MRSSFAGLEVSKRTIQLAQKALDITSNNATNIMTPGYTRQRVDMHSQNLRSFSSWQTKQARLSLAGQGAGAFGVSQVRNMYLDKRFREMNSYLSEYETKQPVLLEIQTMIDVYENVGMDAKLKQFKDALSKYATNAPNNLELASIVRNSAFDIAIMLNSYARDMDKALEDNVFELRATIDYVNTVIDKIVNYNNAIVKEYKATEFGNIDTGRGTSPYGPLELMDERNLLLDELSGFANISVEENADGSINVMIGNVRMIQGSEREHIVMEDFDKFGAAVIYASNGERLSFRAGEIKGFIDLVNGMGPYANHYQSSGYGIPYYREAMNVFAEAFAELMNSTNGSNQWGDTSRAMFGSTLDRYDADGFLIERGPITAATIRITDEWMNDATMIGLVQNPDTGAWAFAPNLDGNHAHRLLLALDEPIVFGRAMDFEGTPFDYIAFISNRLGQGLEFIDDQRENAIVTTNNLLDSRDAVSGVNVDEEGINMLIYQKWYNAAARIMTALDEALDVVINRMGRVGL